MARYQSLAIMIPYSQEVQEPTAVFAMSGHVCAKAPRILFGDSSAKGIQWGLRGGHHTRQGLGCVAGRPIITLFRCKIRYRLFSSFDFNSTHMKTMKRCLNGDSSTERSLGSATDDPRLHRKKGRENCKRGLLPRRENCPNRSPN